MNQTKKPLRLFCFNPFFIRASVYCDPHDGAVLRALGPFQSLLHQGISLLRGQARRSAPGAPAFQSLLHQGISLLVQPRAGCAPTARVGFNPFFIRASVYCLKSIAASSRLKTVSIPSSSGHQFTAQAQGNDFQSYQLCFNPFFIRASVYCPTASARPAPCAAWVSIPSSSGHQFTESPLPDDPGGNRRVSIPSSSGHQFTVIAPIAQPQAER